jgi:hypothetical protein
MKHAFFAKLKRIEGQVVNYVDMLKMKMEMILMILYVITVLEVF